MAPIVRDATPEDLEWLKFHDEQIRKIGDYFIASADKYSDIFTAINAIYIGLLTFFGLASGGVLKILEFPLSIVFLAPTICWIGAMFFFFQVKQPYFTSYSPDSPSDIRNALGDSNIKKGKNYRNGIFLFGIGILFMVAPLVLGLYVAATPGLAAPAADVQLVIENDYVQYANQIPIEFVPGTNKTVNVSLVWTTDTFYQIRLQNGDKVDINKSWVKAVLKK
jgi:hypothetical protein